MGLQASLNRVTLAGMKPATTQKKSPAAKGGSAGGGRGAVSQRCAWAAGGPQRCWAGPSSSASASPASTPRDRSAVHRAPHTPPRAPVPALLQLQPQPQPQLQLQLTLGRPLHVVHRAVLGQRHGGGQVCLCSAAGQIVQLHLAVVGLVGGVDVAGGQQQRRGARRVPVDGGACAGGGRGCGVGCGRKQAAMRRQGAAGAGRPPAGQAAVGRLPAPLHASQAARGRAPLARKKLRLQTVVGSASVKSSTAATAGAPLASGTKAASCALPGAMAKLLTPLTGTFLVTAAAAVRRA
jgi:hypothetical protein